MLKSVRLAWSLARTTKNASLPNSPSQRFHVSTKYNRASTLRKGTPITQNQTAHNMASQDQDGNKIPAGADIPRRSPPKETPSKRKRPNSRPSKKQEKKKRKLTDQTNNRSEGTNEEILSADVKALRRRLEMPASAYSDSKGKPLASQTKTAANIDKFSELDNIEIKELSSTGDGLGTHVDYPSTVFTVPFTSPGDVVRAKIIRDEVSTTTTTTDFVSILRPSKDRDDSLINCKYFATCSGCQFQMLPYAYQLAHKRRVVEHAYKNFSGLPPHAVPKVGETVASPMQYGYRTKLTPHFDGSRIKKGQTNNNAEIGPEVPPIGFMKKGTRHTIDIEDCPIGTPAVQLGFKRERERVAREIGSYRRGATVLLRESTERFPKQDNGDSTTQDTANDEVSTSGVYTEGDAVFIPQKDFTYKKTCISSPTATTTEYVDDFMFKNSANAFFQNNNSILPRFTQYVRDHILPKPESGYNGPKIMNLIDAYSGSGLFTVSLSSLFERSIGIDISVESINFARTNAKLNGLHLSDPDTKPGSEASTSVSFIAATASALFSSVANLDPLATAVVIDPPRKGCDEDFLRQLLDFGPQRIVYVSCNVHTQARDIGWILRNGEEAPPLEDDAANETPMSIEGGDYEMESLTGFDFFPQTSHVESIAVLQRKPRSSIA